MISRESLIECFSPAGGGEKPDDSVPEGIESQINQSFPSDIKHEKRCGFRVTPF